jgi:hypothetical protein
MRGMLSGRLPLYAACHAGIHLGQGTAARASKAAMPSLERSGGSGCGLSNAYVERNLSDWLNNRASEAERERCLALLTKLGAPTSPLIAQITKTPSRPASAPPTSSKQSWVYSATKTAMHGSGARQQLGKGISSARPGTAAGGRRPQTALGAGKTRNAAETVPRASSALGMRCVPCYMHATANSMPAAGCAASAQRSIRPCC